MSLKKLNYKIPEYSKGRNVSSEFFKKLKDSFLMGEPIEILYDYKVNSQENYITDLYLELEHLYSDSKDLEQFKKHYKLFKQSYSSQLRWNVYERFVDFLISIDYTEEALYEWKILQEEEWSDFNQDFTYRDSAIYFLNKIEEILNRNIIDGYFIEKIAPKGKQLTSFGKRNISSVHEIITKIIEATTQKSFFEHFYKNFNHKKRTTFKFEYYKKFFQHNNYFKNLWEIYADENITFSKTKSGNATSDIAVMAIRSECSRLLREAENNYRLSIGAKKVGEEWISETELFYKIKTHFSNFEIIHHGRPHWLGRQHFDIWIPDLKIAIEYQGQQHDKPIDFFGGESAFKKNRERDNLKKRKCELNNIKLIEVRPGYDLDSVFKEIYATMF